MRREFYIIQVPKKTIYEAVRDTAGQYPHDVAWRFMGRQTSYAGLMERIHRTARGFLALGIGRGDRVTLCLPNCPQAVDCFYGLNRIGAVVSLIHPLSAPREIADCLERSRSSVLVTLDRFYARVAAARSRFRQPVTVLVIRLEDELPLLIAACCKLRPNPWPDKNAPYTVLWTDFLQAGRGMPLPPVQGSAHDPAVILYSGGTTGTAKGILLSNGNLNVLGLQTAEACGFAPLWGLKMLSVMPMFHGFGLGIGIHTALMGGAVCILVPKFDRTTYAKLLLKERPNIIPGVPTLFEALLRAEKLEHADLGFLKGVFCGGDSLSVELKRKVDSFLEAHGAKVKIRQGYGLTECVTASCLMPADKEREGSVGIPFPGMRYKICRPGTQETVPVGEEGEICISGPSVMLGYEDAPEETAAALQTHTDGRTWLHTGDLGKMDRDGFVYFSQRIKRMIITSGYNVYPSRLENIIDGHPKVLLSCVIGVEDDYRMQKVKAFVVLREDVTPTEAVREELLAWCRERIAGYAVPWEIEFRRELPKTLVGKVDYRALEEEEAEKRG